MKFGWSLRNAAYEPWKDSYIDYDFLKSVISEANKRQKQGEAPSEDVEGSEDVRFKFQKALDAQIETVVEFYKKKEEELLDETEVLRRKIRQALNAHTEVPSLERTEALDDAVASAQNLAAQIGHLIAFVSLNMIAIRKILKKYARRVGRTIPPMPGRLMLEIEHPEAEHAPVQQGSFLLASIASDLERMQEHAELNVAIDDLRNFLKEAQEHRCMLVKMAVRPLPSFGDRLLSMLDRDVQALQNATEEADRNSALVHPIPWFERAAGMFEPAPPEEYATANLAGLIVNNLSCMLYMANYTAVLPPTEMVCKRLGIPSSYTGAIMGASDLAAAVASIFVSFWTQRSFKEPILFSALVCIIGNVAFVFSFLYKSFPLLIIARLFNGLGSARTANRRYTADFVSKKSRTMASAAFVGASNFGQALGPLLSLPLALLPDDYKILGATFNAVTAVGYSMALFWALFLFFSIFYFEEPSKATPIGLQPALSRLNISSKNGEDGILKENSGKDDESMLESLLEADEDSTQRADTSSGQRLAIDNESSAGTSYGQNIANEQVGGSKKDRRNEWIPTVIPTLATISCLFVQKMVQQAYSDGVPLFASGIYDWNTRKTSLWLGFIGLLGVPCNLIIGLISSQVSDRTMVLWSVCASIASLFWLQKAAVEVWAYFGGGTVLFLATVALEGTATSLMSKVIWRGFARGVFNAGLLSTEAGTFGRFLGNAVLTIIGRHTGVEDKVELNNFAIQLHLFLAVICIGLLVQLMSSYNKLRG